METVFIVMADRQEYCTNQWVCGVFTAREKAEEHRDKAQARADEAHAKIRAMGEEDGIPARWRDVCLSDAQRRELEELDHPAWLARLKAIKRATFPEDPNAEFGWDGTMTYTVQEWAVDVHRHEDFPQIMF